MSVNIPNETTFLNPENYKMVQEFEYRLPIGMKDCSIEEFILSNNYKYCPYCGTKIKFNDV